jgi:hypothetical protein
VAPDGANCHLFVTDYTIHDYGPRLKTEDLTTWAKGLDKRIFKIWLRDAQAQIGRNMEAGEFYDINKVRMKKGTGEYSFMGFLGGAERLIYKLNPKGTKNERLQALLS